MQTSDIPIFGKVKTLLSGIILENKIYDQYQKYCWVIKGTDIIHNEGEPAIEYKDGDRYWMQHGKLHRLDGSAVEWACGTKDCYINGKFFPKKEYWDHPDVLEYQFLQKHPELKAFV